MAWNENLASGARSHNAALIAGGTLSYEFPHQLPGEAAPGQRATAAGYTNWSRLGENVTFLAESDLVAQAAFMVDWGAGANGMQSPPGHRTNLMNPLNREVGIGISLDDNPPTGIGPLVVTEDFGTRNNSGAFILGAAYNDTDHDNFYSPGEGLGTLSVMLGATSVTSWASGGFTLNTAATGTQTVTFSGAGLSGPVGATVDLTPTSNVMFNVVSGTTLETSASVSVSGPIATLRGLGITGLNLSTPDATAHTIIGTKGNDHLDGGASADVLDGSAGNEY